MSPWHPLQHTLELSGLSHAQQNDEAVARSRLCECADSSPNRTPLVATLLAGTTALVSSISDSGLVAAQTFIDLASSTTSSIERKPEYKAPR